MITILTRAFGHLWNSNIPNIGDRAGYFDGNTESYVYITSDQNISSVELQRKVYQWPLGWVDDGDSITVPVVASNPNLYNDDGFIESNFPDCRVDVGIIPNGQVYELMAINPGNTCPGGFWKDSDSDGVTDGQEKIDGTDPFNPDTDGDGVSDGQEKSDGTNPLNPDTDGDGVSDGQEKTDGTDPFNPDTDADGLSDSQEKLFGTDPLSPDSDGDGESDSQEINQGTDPLDPESNSGGGGGGGCEDERTVCSGYRITINGLDLFGDAVADMFDVPAEDHWLPEGIGWSHISVFKSITRVVIRPLNGVSSGGTMTLSVRRYQVPVALSPIAILENILNNGFSQDLPVCTVNFSKCAINGDYSFTGASLDNLLFQRFTNLKIEVTGLQGANEDICCDETNDTGQESGGELPIQEPYDGQDCCDALWVYVYKLSARINTLEIKMTEIADGLDCICQAIQALSFSPVIEVKPADSVNEINLPEMAPVINISPCEPIVTVQASTPINQINLPAMQPIIEVKPADSVNEITVQPCQPLIEVKPADSVNEIIVQPCQPIINNILEDVRINGGVDIRLENLEAIQTAIMAALSCNGINITCVIAGLLEKLQTMIDSGGLDLDKYFLQDEKNLLKILRELLTTTDPCTDQERTVSELIQEKEMVVFVENEQDIRTIEDRSINKCCPTAEK